MAEGEGIGEFPWIISVDDHVVEPPHVWQAYLPAGLRDRGPRVVHSPVTAIPTLDGKFGRSSACISARGRSCR